MDLTCQLCLKMPCECGAGEVPLEIFEQTVHDSLDALIRNAPKAVSDPTDLESGLEAAFASIGRVFDGLSHTDRMDTQTLFLLLTHEKSPFRLKGEDLIVLAEELLEAAGCPIEWTNDADVDIPKA